MFLLEYHHFSVTFAKAVCIIFSRLSCCINNIYFIKLCFTKIKPFKDASQKLIFSFDLQFSVAMIS